MEHDAGACATCGMTEWVEATPEQYVAAAQRLRDATGDAAYVQPDRVLICRGCGRTRIVLSQTFGVSHLDGEPSK